MIFQKTEVFGGVWATPNTLQSLCTRAIEARCVRLLGVFKKRRKNFQFSTFTFQFIFVTLASPNLLGTRKKKQASLFCSSLVF